MHDAITVGDVVLDPPLVNGSGVVDVVSSDEGWNLPVEQLSKLGAFTTKTITLHPREGHPQPWAEVVGPGSLINAAGLPNPGVASAMLQWSTLPASLGIPIIVSVSGAAETIDELIDVVSGAGWCAAIELNLSCPNVSGGLVASSPSDVGHLIARARARTSLPLIAKLTPACGAIGEVARSADAAGASAITCCNTMPSLALDGAGLPLLGGGSRGGVSGAFLHPLALRVVADARAATALPIIGLGGVDSLAAARRMMSAGADIIGVGTGAIFDPNLISALATTKVQAYGSGCA